MRFLAKYKKFIKHDAPFDILEGQTYSGKTTVGASVKFMLKVAESPKKYHGIAAKDIGTAEKNIINAERGILAEWGDYVKYNGGGSAKIKLAHIVFKQDDGSEKIIYVFGYGDKARWKAALGGQLGCLFVDEANIADVEFLQEAAIRQDYMCWTLNPDNPDLPIYGDYINHARPLPEYICDYPEELLEQLNKEPKPGYVHWYFTAQDNYAYTPEKWAQIVGNTPVGSKLYKNKILGLRGRATGLVFNLLPEHIKPQSEVYERFSRGDIGFRTFTCGVDTSYSKNTDDKFTFTFEGITTDRRHYTLDEEGFNNKDRAEKGLTLLAPSDIPPLLVAFLERNRQMWGFARDVYIDSADSATLTECLKYKRKTGCIYNFFPAWKKTPIIDRINLVSGWLARGYYYVLSHCKGTIKEFNTYSWKEEKDEPEDANDHFINSSQYAWLPYKGLIGDYNSESST